MAHSLLPTHTRRVVVTVVALSLLGIAGTAAAASVIGAPDVTVGELGDRLGMYPGESPTGEPPMQHSGGACGWHNWGG